MSVFSARYATSTLAVLMVALVPTVMTSYVRQTVVEQPALREALPVVLEDRASVPTDRKASTIRREFDSEDWAEREYRRVGETPVTVLAVRSYDMKRLYHHPELAVSEADYETARVSAVSTPQGQLDVHVLTARDGKPGLAAYALIYRGRTVTNPLLFQLTVAPELLVMGRRPLALVFAEDPAYRLTPELDVVQSSAVRSVVAVTKAITSQVPR
jgi:hypothetical protein